MIGGARVTELGYLGLRVSDGAAWKRFAAEVLGMQVVDGEKPGTFFLRLDAWHHRFVVRVDDGDDLDFMAWRVADADALDEIGARVEAQGFACHWASDTETDERHVLGLLKLESPGGVPVEVFHGPRVDRHQPFHPGRPMYGAFKTGLGGMGHLTVAEPDEKAALAFYRDGLGLRGGVEYVYRGTRHTRRIQFFSCGPRQHSIGFWTGEHAQLLQHVMVECTDLNDVGRAHDLAVAAGIPITSTLGVHANDQMVSFYMRSPSGFHIECGWGGHEPSPQSEYFVSDVWGHSQGGS